MMEGGTIDLQRLPGELLTLLVDPTSNLLAALVLYAIITVVLLIVVVLAIMFIISTPEEDEEGGDASRAEYDAGGDADDSAGLEPLVGTDDGVGAGAGSAAARPPRNRLVTLAWVAGTALAVWVAAGASTASDALCESCHVETAHTLSTALADPHARVGCVSCHEPGGLPGRFVTGVPARVGHIAGSVFASGGDAYGRVTEAACASCHRSGIAGVTVDDVRGLSMSHAEPLEAGVRCIECHRLTDGVVAAHTAGMNPCLRCHDSQTASAECATCHDETAAAAARARSTGFARPQVEWVRCGGCHDEQRYCDPCHGTRMPHSPDFMRYSHARAAAVDFWFNGGDGCVSCHTPERRPCTRCHTSMIGSGHGPGLAQTHSLASEQACNTCHQAWAFMPQRDFCADVCHSEAALAESPR